MVDCSLDFWEYITVSLRISPGGGATKRASIMLNQITGSQMKSKPNVWQIAKADQSEATHGLFHLYFHGCEYKQNQLVNCCMLRIKKSTLRGVHHRFRHQPDGRTGADTGSLISPVWHVYSSCALTPCQLGQRWEIDDDIQSQYPHKQWDGQED